MRTVLALMLAAGLFVVAGCGSCGTRCAAPATFVRKTAAFIEPAPPAPALVSTPACNIS